MNDERIVYNLDRITLWVAICNFFPADTSLRDMARPMDVSASTLSRLSKGYSLDMDSFCKICGHCKLNSGDYFIRERWVKS